MKSVIFSLVLYFLLPVFLAQKKTCYTCHGVNSDSCKGEETECEDSDCMTVSEEFGDANETTHSISKRCAKNFPCNTHYYLYSGKQMWLSYHLQCCKEDKCNTGNFNMPKLEGQEEGVLCPTCLEENTLDGCNATRSSVCLHKDDLCLIFRGILRLTNGKVMNVSGQGCGSKIACSMDESSLIATRVEKEMEYKCYLPPSKHD